MRLQSVELPPLKKQHISMLWLTMIFCRSVLVNLASEIKRSASLVDADRPKVPKSVQEFFNLPDRINPWGNGCWGSC